MPSVSDNGSEPKNSTTWNSADVSAEKMQRLDRLANLGLLSAGMAHEIKNGMVAIQTFVDLLLEKNQDAELGEVVRHEFKRINAIPTPMLQIPPPNYPPFPTAPPPPRLHPSLRPLHPQLPT